jgi:hypothetical protein
MKPKNAEISYLLPTKKMSVDQMITSRKEYIKEWYMITSECM